MFCSRLRDVVVQPVVVAVDHSAVEEGRMQALLGALTGPPCAIAVSN